MVVKDAPSRELDLPWLPLCSSLQNVILDDAEHSQDSGLVILPSERPHCLDVLRTTIDRAEQVPEHVIRQNDPVQVQLNCITERLPHDLNGQCMRLVLYPVERSDQILR